MVQDHGIISLIKQLQIFTFEILTFSFPNESVLIFFFRNSSLSFISVNIRIDEPLHFLDNMKLNFRKKDETIYNDKYGYLSMKDFDEQRPLKRLRPCFYSPIQCLMKRRTGTVDNFMDNY